MLWEQLSPLCALLFVFLRRSCCSHSQGLLIPAQLVPELHIPVFSSLQSVEEREKLDIHLCCSFFLYALEKEEKHPLYDLTSLFFFSSTKQTFQKRAGGVALNVAGCSKSLPASDKSEEFVIDCSWSIVLRNGFRRSKDKPPLDWKCPPRQIFVSLRRIYLGETVTHPQKDPELRKLSRLLKTIECCRFPRPLWFNSFNRQDIKWEVKRKSCCWIYCRILSVKAGVIKKSV